MTIFLKVEHLLLPHAKCTCISFENFKSFIAWRQKISKINKISNYNSISKKIDCSLTCSPETPCKSTQPIYHLICSVRMKG